jgi:hypothetical protein
VGVSVEVGVGVADGVGEGVVVGVGVVVWVAVGVGVGLAVAVELAVSVADENWVGATATSVTDGGLGGAVPAISPKIETSNGKARPSKATRARTAKRL